MLNILYCKIQYVILHCQNETSITIKKINHYEYFLCYQYRQKEKNNYNL